MKDKAQDLYKDMACSCLTTYQMIEALLRSILPLLYSRANGAMPSGMCYKWSEKEIGKASLGKLISRLDHIYSADPDLIRDLRDSVEDRNKLAHWTLVEHYHLEIDADTYISKAEKLQEKCNKLSVLAQRLMTLFGKLEAKNSNVL